MGPSATPEHGALWRRRKLFRFLLALGIFLTLLLALEGLLRATHLFGARLSVSRPDPLISWRYQPRRSYWHWLENDHPITGRINRHGWRDRDRSLTKPEGSVRVAVLGDSYVEAIQVELDSTFLALTERAFQARNETVEVLDFGRSGMTQTEEFLVLQNDVMRFSPDIVVLFFLPGNDISDISRRTTSNSLRPFYTVDAQGELVLDTRFNQSRGYKLRAWIQPFKERSVLVSLLTERYNAVRRARNRPGIRDEEGMPQQIVGSVTLCTASPDSAYVASYRLNKIIMRKMFEFCRERGIDFLLVCINHVYRPEEIAQFQRMDASFNPEFFAADLRRMTAAYGMDYLSFQEPFQRFYAETGSDLTWGHWNYAGHRLVARELVGKLAEMMAARRTDASSGP
jgi:hypothetical protein